MMVITRSSHQRCSVKKVFLEISQNLQENICARVSFLIKLQAEARNLIQKVTLTPMFSVNLVKFLGTPFLLDTFKRLHREDFFLALSF